MIYDEAIRYIKNIERAGIDLGLERMRVLLDLLGAPDKRLKCVHIAGTNGKGSVSAYMTSILMAAGYRVGTYNSPSVFRYNERWLIDGEPLSDESVAKFLTAVKETIDGKNKTIEEPDAEAFCPTAFEIETAAAFLVFSANSCDVCVIETGLGGRWDATNAMTKKELAIITPIGLDHCGYLGNTLGEIATEKAAIIDGDAVTCEQCEEVMRELARPYRMADGKRIDMPCRLYVAAPYTPLEDSIDGQRFEYEGEEYFVRMLGEHQLQNASIAVCAAKRLAQKGYDIGENDIKTGLANAVWHGRFEIVQNAKQRFYLDVPDGKTLVFDGAHNPHGAEALRAATQKYFGDKRVHVVMGVLKDKDVDGIAELIAPLASKATAVTPPSPRAMQKETLRDIIAKWTPCDVAESVRDGVQAALDGDCDVVLLAGSLTLFEGLTERP